ncbi:MAG: hypothetical protein WAK93_15855 [Solirubrobacteraceae bacterium]
MTSIATPWSNPVGESGIDDHAGPTVVPSVAVEATLLPTGPAVLTALTAGFAVVTTLLPLVATSWASC